MENEHYKHKRPIRSLWEEEREKFLQLPQDPFEVFQLETAKLDKYGKVHMDQERISVPGGDAQQLVSLKVYWDCVEVMDEAYETIAASRVHLVSSNRK